MDRSKKYIKMCAEAREIQELHDNDSIWLPRQDQLQHMLGKHMFAKDILWEIVAWLDNDPLSQKQREEVETWGNYTGSFNTPEQLWLAFIMHEKYDKIWKTTKEEWETV